MQLNLREQLLIEKCLNSIIRDYEIDKVEDINSLIDLKLNFLSFLQHNELEEVLYGIEYLKLRYPTIAELLGSIILEFEVNRFRGSLYCKPIPSNEPEQPSTFWSKLRENCLQFFVNFKNPLKKVSLDDSKYFVLHRKGKD